MATVGQRFDDPAFGHSAASAFLDHSQQLGPQVRQGAYPFFNLGQASLRDLIGHGARLIWVVLKQQQRADRFQIEPEFPSMMLFGPLIAD